MIASRVVNVVAGCILTALLGVGTFGVSGCSGDGSGDGDTGDGLRAPAGSSEGAGNAAGGSGGEGEGNEKPNVGKRTISDAVYEVPTDASLAAYAANVVTVQHEVLAADDARGSFRLVYDLPTVIAGKNRTVELFGAKDARGVVMLTGPAGDGSCAQEANGDLVCHEHLYGVPTSLSEALAEVEAVSKSEEERLARRAVAEQFVNDPLGIVRYRPASRE